MMTSGQRKLFQDQMKARIMLVAIADCDKGTITCFTYSPPVAKGKYKVLGADPVETGLLHEGEILMPLDDAYIHFQYAKQTANGHPYIYNPGDDPTSGATRRNPVPAAAGLIVARACTSVTGTAIAGRL